MLICQVETIFDFLYQPTAHDGPQLKERVVKLLSVLVLEFLLLAATCLNGSVAGVLVFNAIHRALSLTTGLDSVFLAGTWSINLWLVIEVMIVFHRRARGFLNLLTGNLLERPLIPITWVPPTILKAGALENLRREREGSS